ncbi:MAG: hypothetical protein WC816_07185 [Sphingomonas sp.]
MRWGLVIFGLLLAAPSATIGQLKPEAQTGSRIAVNPETVAAKQAGIVKKGFAACVYRRHKALAQTLLEHSDQAKIDATGAQIKDFGEQFDMSHCLGDEVGAGQLSLGYRFGPTLLRAMMAEEAYLDTNRTAPQLSASATENVARTYFATDEALLRAQAWGQFSDCIVFHDVAMADALLRTTPASDAEHDAAAALAPSLGACLVQGQKLSLSPASIRQFVADGMWMRFGHSGTRQ